MEGKHICQSCGTAIDSQDLFGTHGDGHRNEDYCIHCYKNGTFIWNPASDYQISTLKRWMEAEDKASWILDRCGYVTLSTIDEQGFPRPVAVDVIQHDGIRVIWMTTYCSSAKARHISSNSKVGISFVREADCVSLTGIAEVIVEKNMLRRHWKDFFIHYYHDGVDDENYCLIRFVTKKAKLWIDGESPTFSF